MSSKSIKNVSGLIVNRHRIVDFNVPICRSKNGAVTNSIQVQPRSRRSFTLSEAEFKVMQAFVDQESHLELQLNAGETQDKE